MSKVPERLIILKNHGEGIIERLLYTKRIFSNPTQRPSFLGDPQFSKALNALMKKFPEFENNVDKSPGMDILIGKAKIFSDELEPHYLNFSDAYEFKDATIGVLSEIASNKSDLKLDENPLLTVSYMDLFLLYIQINILISSIEERKIIMAVYYKLYYYLKYQSEPNFPRISNYLIMFDNPIKAMQDEFKPLSNFIGKILNNLTFIYSKIRTIPSLRKEGVLNITLKPEDMNKPITDKFHYQMVLASQMYSWITYGFLLCPESFSLNGSMDLCKVVLSEGFVMPVFKSCTIQLHEYYDNLFSNYKTKTLNLTKNKKFIKDVWQEAVLKSSQKRKERRIFLKQELNVLWRLFIDKPALIGVKFPMLLSGLSLAVEEIFWYFRHIKAPIPKIGKKISEDDFKDNKISELIFLVDNLNQLILKHKKIIQMYYLEYLHGADYNNLKSVLDSCLTDLGPGVEKIIRSILEELSSISIDAFNNGNQYDFKALRLNWFRVEAYLPNNQLSKFKSLLDRMNLIINHTRYVDEIEDLLEKFSPLKNLWYWKDSVLEIFSQIIKDGPNQPLHVMSFLRLFSIFPSCTNQYNSEERSDIGNQCVSLVEKMLNEVVNRITELLTQIAKQYINFDSQLEEVNVAYQLIYQNKKDSKGPKETPPILPGSESEFRKRQELETLRLYERNTWQLCSALNSCEFIIVYNTKFSPREFLKEKLVTTFQEFIHNMMIIEIVDEKHKIKEKMVQRPSVLEKKINIFASVLKFIENFVSIDVGELLRTVYLNETWIKPIGKGGSCEWIDAEETDFKFDGSIVGSYSNWYSEFISKKISLSGSIFSPNRKSFVSKNGSFFKAEMYTDMVELRSLCKLIGPYGVKVINREILKFILSNVNSIKDHISHNRQVLDELSKVYPYENQCNDVLKKLRDVDGFLIKAISIGNALCFRQLLYEALQEILQEEIPLIYSTIKTSFNQYARNTYQSPEFLAIDMLAMECGIPVETADQNLKKFLAKAIGSVDGPLIDLLPYMLAASFVSNVWKEAQFKPIVEAHNNNIHTLAQCANDLIIAFKALTTNTADENEIITLFKIFVEVSSIILLRMAKTPQKPDKHAPIDFPSIIIFMDKFIESSLLLKRDTLENFLPYALLRYEWKSIYSPMKLKEGKKDNSNIVAT